MVTAIPGSNEKKFLKELNVEQRTALPPPPPSQPPVTPPPPAPVQAVPSTPVPRALPDRAGGVRPDPKPTQERVDAHRSPPPRIKLHADADAAIDRLARRARLALISDGPLVMQEAKVAALDVRSLIELVVLTDQWGRSFWKPHPRAFLLVEEATGTNGRRCLYVGDNPTKDFGAPTELGWMTVQVKRPGGEYAGEKHRGTPAAACITSLLQLGQLLDVP